MDGPSQYAIERNDPANSNDPMGTVREEQQPDPKDKKAKSIQLRYEKAYAEFKKGGKGAAAAKRLEDDPNIKLTIVYDPNYNKPGEAALTKDFRFDPATGRVVSATVVVGPNFDKKIDDSRYPYGRTLEPRSTLRQIYTVAHEEQGHFMNAVTDPEYTKRLKREEEPKEEFNRAKATAEQMYPDSAKQAVARQKEYVSLVPGIAEKTKEITALSSADEGQADETARIFVEDYKKP